MSRGFIYLAGPYTHPDPKVRKSRETQITKMASMLVNTGMSVHSPITNSAPFERLGVRKSGAEWLLHDVPLMEAAQFLVVLTLPGWQESEGIAEEIKFFRDRNKPVFFLSPDYGENTVFTTWNAGF